MKVTQVYDKRKNGDCLINLECEDCGATESGERGHNNEHFWNNIIPIRKCPICHKSTNDLKQEA